MQALFTYSFRYMRNAATFILLFAVLGIAPDVNGPSDAKSRVSTELSPQRSSSTTAKLNLAFIENNGQYPETVRFAAQSRGQNVFFGPSDVMFVLRSTDVPTQLSKGKGRSSASLSTKHPTKIDPTLRLRLKGSDGDCEVVPEEMSSGSFNFLKGTDSARWLRNQPGYGRIRYKSLYPGIDLIFYGNEGRLQYDFVVAPGADPQSIAFYFDGAKRIERTGEGDLLVSSDAGDITLSQPFAYQVDISGERRKVDAEFKVSTSNIITFDLGEYDTSRILVIDPILTYSTFLGGSIDDVGNAVTVDADGNAYITGTTQSIDFPVSPSGTDPIHGNPDAFVTKIDATGSNIIYSTVVGSRGPDEGYDVAVDATGSAYVVGKAGFPNFPQQNPLSYNSTVRKTALGSNNWQAATGVNTSVIAISGSRFDPLVAMAAGDGGVHKTIDGGLTWRTINHGLSNSNSLIKAVTLSPHDSNTALAGNKNTVYRTVNGGSSWSPLNFDFGGDYIEGIAFDRSDVPTAYVWKEKRLYRTTNSGTSWTNISAGLGDSYVKSVVNHPTLPGVIYAATSGGLFKSSNYGSSWTGLGLSLVYSLCFDVSNPSIIYAGSVAGVYKNGPAENSWTRISVGLTQGAIWSILQDPNNPQHLYLAMNFMGVQRSTDGGVHWEPFNNGITTGSTARSLVITGENLLIGLERSGPVGGFVFKLNAAGDDFIYSSIFAESNSAVAVDAAGRAHVAGTTDYVGLPLVNPLKDYSGNDDGYIAIFSPDGGHLEFSSYFGSSGEETLNGLALDSIGNIYLTGDTSSSTFPLVAPFQSQRRGQRDAWLAKLLPGGSGYVYSTYFGGSQFEASNAIVSDIAGNAYITGSTSSADLPMGVIPSLQTLYGGKTDAFVSKFDPNGSSLLYTTYLGGAEWDVGHDVSTTQNGEIVVAGETSSVDFPTHRSIKSKVPIMRSADRGLKWRNDFDGVAAAQVRSISLHPTISGTLLIATERGIFRSSDHGENWTAVNSGLNTRNVRAVAYSKSNPSIVFAGTLPTIAGVAGGGVYKSVDGGINWQAMNNGISIGTQQIYAIAVSPSDPNLVFAGSNGFDPGYPLYRSTDGGQTWSTAATSVIVNISVIQFDENNPSTLYVGSSRLTKNLVKSLDSGSTWQIIQNFPNDTAVGSIALDKSQPSRIYVGSISSIHITTNGGGSWQNVSSTSANGSPDLAIDPFNENRIFAATHSGLLISEDRGANWRPEASELMYKWLSDIAIDKFTEGVMFTAMEPPVEMDAFVAKISSAGDSFSYSTIFGSTGDPADFVPLYLGPFDYAHGVALSPTGSVLVTGYTRVSTFPTTPGAVSNAFGGYYEGFVSQLDETRKIMVNAYTSEGAPIEDVDLEITGSVGQSGRTGLDGKYKFNQVPINGTFEMTPRKLGYLFEPPSRTISNLQADTTIAFQAIQDVNTISGQLLHGKNAVVGGTVVLSGSSSQARVTGIDGRYSFEVESAGDYQILPQKSGLIFLPASRSFANLTTDVIADFSGRVGFTISGQVVSNGVGMGGVPVEVSGTESTSTFTDGDGEFEFQLGAGSTFTVTPLSPGVRFDPPFVAISELSESTNLQFRATFNAISPGRIVYKKTSIVEEFYNDEIYVQSNGGPVRLSNNLVRDANPAWSPDGRRIAFSTERDGNFEIYLMNADGSEPTRITHDAAADSEPAWSPDGLHIVFVKKIAGTNSSELYVINVDGTGEKRLTNNYAYEYGPAWSPDGNEIAFVSEGDGDSEIFVTDFSGTHIRRLTENNIPDRNPDWSPDGSRISFDSGVGINREIWTMRRDGTDRRKITESSVEARSPSYSPDGSQIAFVKMCSSAGLFVIGANGGSETQIGDCNALDEPDWQGIPVRRPHFDYDGDGRSDLSVVRPSNNVWYLLQGTAGYTAQQFGEAGDGMTPADYDGDGKTDVAVFRPATGTWFVFASQTQTFQQFGWGANGDLPVPTDRDNDGKADLVVFRPSNNTWYTRYANGTFATTEFGVAGDKPLVGDFDADGIGDIALFRPSNNNWYILKSSLGFFIQTWGETGDIPVPADFDGDGATDQGVFRPSTGQWFLSRTTDGFGSQNWGQVGDIPVAADYDGDGKADVAVFRPTNGTWYIVNSSTGQLIQQFGQAGDVPTQSAFLY